MAAESESPGGNIVTRSLRALAEDWRSLSTKAKLLVAGSWTGLLALDGAAVYLTLSSGVPAYVFYAVLVATGLLSSAPAYKMATRKRVKAPTVKPPPKPEPATPVVEEEKASLFSRLGGLIARPVSPRVRVYVIATSAILTLVLVLFSTFVYPTYLRRPEYDNYMIATFLVGLLAPSFVDLVDRRYKSVIDSRIPDFLREIGEAQRTGTPFTKALVNASQSNYGPLSVELRRAMSKMSWGLTFEEALDSFAGNVDTPLAHRAAVLLKEVGRSGGKMLEVLESVYEHVRDVIGLQRERSKQLTPYVAVVYAAFGVYLFVVYILFTTFFAQVANLQSTGAPFGSNINPGVYYIWFFHMSVIEGLFGGMVIGKISSGSSVGGMKHVLLLLTISLFFFTLFVKY